MRSCHRRTETPLEPVRGKLAQCRLTSRRAHGAREFGVGEEAFSRTTRLVRGAGHESVDAIRNRRAGMRVGDYGKPRGHGLAGRHVESVLVRRICCMDIEPMLRKQALERVPVLGGFDPQLGIMPDQRDRESVKTLDVEVPVEEDLFGDDMVGDPQAGGTRVGRGEVVVDVRAVAERRAGDPPGSPFQVGDCHDVGALQRQVLAEPLLHLRGRDIRPLLRDPSFNGLVDHQQLGGVDRGGIQEVGDVVTNHQIPRTANSRERVGEFQGACVPRKGAHPGIPS